MVFSLSTYRREKKQFFNVQKKMDLASFYAILCWDKFLFITKFCVPLPFLVSLPHHMHITYNTPVYRENSRYTVENSPHSTFILLLKDNQHIIPSTIGLVPLTIIVHCIL